MEFIDQVIKKFWMQNTKLLLVLMDLEQMFRVTDEMIDDNSPPEGEEILIYHGVLHVSANLDST